MGVQSIWIQSIIIALLLVWDIFSQLSFTHAEGNLKRGVKVWSQLLTPDEYYFLEDIPESIKSEKAFILLASVIILSYF